MSFFITLLVQTIKLASVVTLVSKVTELIKAQWAGSTTSKLINMSHREVSK